MIVLVFVALLAVIQAVENAIDITSTLTFPGKVLMWSPSASKSSTQHLTASYDVPRAIDNISSEAKNYEAIIVLQNSEFVSRSCLEYAVIQQSVHRAPMKSVINHVYLTDPQMKSISDSINEAHGTIFKRLDTVVTELQAMPGLLSNGKPELYHASFDHNTLHALNKLQEIADTHNILLVAYDEPHPFPVTSRRLSTNTTNTGDSQSIYYKPEGAEYSIYYADTYLYITPDIFTGLLTGIFFAFVVFIGVTCLGSIQGMSSFYDKLPVVGKEA